MIPTTRLPLVLLPLLLISQTAWRIEGYPYRQSQVESPEIKSRDHISLLIETAYNSHELQRKEEWMRNHKTKWPMERDDTRHQEDFVYLSSTQQQAATEAAVGQRKLLQNREDSSNTGMSSQLDGKIVFPTDDDMPHQQVHQFNFRSVPTCQGSTFCEDVADYPGHLVNVAIAHNNSLKYLANVDMVSDIVQRIDATDEALLCATQEQVVYPQTAENKQKEWLFVVNQDNFKQGVRIETCTEEDRKCRLIDGFAEGYETMCKQKFIYRQLAAVGTDGKVITDMFRFPSSCCCHVRYISEPLGARIGLINERSNQTAMKARKRK